MNNPWFFPAAALVVGAAGGYISGKNTQTTGHDNTTENSSRRTRSSSRAEASSTENTGKHANRVSSAAEISRLPGNSDRIKALLDFYAGLTPGQLEEEARKLEDLPMNERIMASILLFGRWAEKDPMAAMAYTKSMGFTGMFVKPTILQSWASTDPANAAKYFAANPREFAMMGGRGPMGGQSSSGIIASEWARQDPAAALAWANSLTTDKSQAVNSVIGEVAKTDPKKAAAMLASAEGSDKGDAYRSVASQYGEQNFSEAQSWIRSLPADEQPAAMAAAIGGLSNKDPQAAANQVELMAAGDAKDGAITSIVADWARLNPQAAAEFLKKQDSENAQQGSMRELMSTWTGQDPTAALAYANSFAAGSVRDSALESYVWSNSSAAPTDLVKIAESIVDEGNRNRSIGVAAARWMREDPPAAKAYIEQSTILSAESKQRIIDNRGPGRGGRNRGN